MDNFIEQVFPYAFFIGLIAFVLIKVFFDSQREKAADDNVTKAEQQAFTDQFQIINQDGQIESETGAEDATERIAIVGEPDEIDKDIKIGRLFNLYSKQIEKYQQQTRSRATWSFIFAIFAMFCGLAFIFWGGSVLLKSTETIKLAAGGLITTIGGAVSAYITKTFLDVHKLSLNQLNRYFKQPVINDHIVMSQRLANGIDDPPARQKAYEKIIDSITTLIRYDKPDDEDE